MTSTILPVPQLCPQRSPSNSSLESSTPPSPDHMRMGNHPVTPPPRTHNGRQRLRPFLISLLNSGKVKGLEWVNKDKTLFKIPWKHAGKQDYNPEEDSKIFKLWSSNTGKYKEGIHVPEPAVWKTRLRTALNKLPDIEEIQDKTQLDIPEPYRVYKLHPKKPSGSGRIGKRPPYQEPSYPHQVQSMSHSVSPYATKGQNGYDIPYSRHYYPQHQQQSIPEYDYNGYPLSTYHRPERRDSTNDLLQDVESVIRQNSPPHFNSHDLTSCSPSSMYQQSRDMPDGGVGDETATKIARAMMTNNNDPMQMNFHDLVPAATHPENMGYNQATTKSYSDYNQTSLYNSTCAPVTMPTDTMSNCGPQRLDDPMPMDMSCQQSQGSRHSSVDELPSEQTMMIQVYYRSLNAGSYQVDNPSGCMLYSKQPWDDGRGLGMESIPLPDISDIISPETPGINPKTIELTSEVLRCFEKGMSIQCKNGGDIYVTRRCRSVVFWGVAQGVSGEGHTHDKLEREEEVKVFDLQEFRDRMRQYLRGEKQSPPIPEIYFTVAQKWAGAPDTSLHSCLVSMVLTPSRAAVELRSVNHDIKTPPHSAHSGMVHFSGPDVPTPPSSHWAAEWNSHSHHYPSSPAPPTVFAAYT